MIAKAYWLIILFLVSCFGVTLSWVMLAVCAVCVAVGGILFSCSNMHIKRTWDVLEYVLFVAVCYFVCRICGSPVWDLAKEDLMLIAIGLVVYTVSRCRKMDTIWLSILALTALVNVSYFVIQKLGYELLLPIAYVSKHAQASKDYGLFQDYGALGNSLSISGMVLICYASRVGGRRWIKLSTLLIGCGAILTALVSGSRSAVISIAIAGLFYVVVSWLSSDNLTYVLRKKVRYSLGLFSLVGSICIVVFGVEVFTKKSINDEFLPEHNIRSAYWGMAIEQGIESPFIGKGARSYSYECFRFWSPKMHTREGNPEFAHNEYLQFWADYGAIGLLLLVLVLLAHIFKGTYELLVQESHRRQNQWIILAGIVGLIVVIVHSFTDFPQRLPWNLCLAAVCLAWCNPREHNRDPVNILPVSVRKIMILTLCSGMAIYSSREVWAGMPLIASKQIREDGAWNTYQDMELVCSLEKAADRSPDYRRFLHLGQIYHSNLDSEENVKIAIKNYQNSLNRNPYNVVAMMGLANMYGVTGDFERADNIYTNAEPYAASRDWWLKYYLTWGKLVFAEAAVAAMNGNLEEAEDCLKKAYLISSKATSAATEVEKFQREIYLVRIRIAISNANYEFAQQLWDEAKVEVQPWIWNAAEGNVHLTLGDEYMIAAVREWRMRKPEIAKELFQKSKLFYMGDRQVNKGVVEGHRLEKIEYIERQLKLLAAAGF